MGEQCDIAQVNGGGGQTGMAKYLDEASRDETKRDETRRNGSSALERSIRREGGREGEGVRTGEPTDLDTIFRHSCRFSVHTQLGLAKKKMTVPFPTLGHYFLQNVLQHRYFANNMYRSLFHCPVPASGALVLLLDGGRQQEHRHQQQQQRGSKRNGSKCTI